MHKPVMELVTFKTIANCTPEAFAAASESVSAWVRTQPGFQSRTLSCDDEGTWFDVVLWDSAEAAQAASTNMMAELGQCEFMALIDPGTIQMQHPKVMGRA